MNTNVFPIRGSDWQLHVTMGEGEEVENFVIKRANGQHFHLTMVNDSITLPDGKDLLFRQPMIFEHDNGRPKVGDIVVQLRKHPTTHRFCVETDSENAISDDGETVNKAIRLVRSSLDNIRQTVKKQVETVGTIFTNLRRIGGKPIECHMTIDGWSPQKRDSMMDVQEFVQTSPDALGLATLMKTLASPALSDNDARMLLEQIRTKAPANA